MLETGCWAVVCCSLEQTPTHWAGLDRHYSKPHYCYLPLLPYQLFPSLPTLIWTVGYLLCWPSLSLPTLLLPPHRLRPAVGQLDFPQASPHPTPTAPVWDIYVAVWLLSQTRLGVPGPCLTCPTDCARHAAFIPSLPTQPCYCRVGPTDFPHCPLTWADLPLPRPMPTQVPDFPSLNIP